MFCKHNWEILSETVTKSKWDDAVSNLKQSRHEGGVNIPWQMCNSDRKHIQIVTCKKCGKLKRFVEKI